MYQKDCVMKKNLFLSFAILISVCIANAVPVDSTIAKTVAKNFYGKVTNRAVRNLSFENVDLSYFQNFYVFNEEGGNGFVIVSADDRAIPILGYSENGSVITDNLPINIVEWLSGYESEIEWAKHNIFEADEETTELWGQMMDNAYEPIRSDRAVSPLLNTKWGQDAPYNYYCPYNSFVSKTCPTGCVATAMAQVMKYWEWPTRGNGSHSYSCWPYGTQSANFYNAYYHWYDMPNTNPSSSNQSIAKLMYHCGVSVEMDYGIDGSGAVIEDCVDALKDYFRYSTSVCYVEKGNYTDSQWRSLLKTELDNNRPIIYGGQGSNGGHAFVCDGYNNSNYFHFNWGWEGNYDNYFSLSALSPDSYNYSNNQVAVIGIEPNSSYGGYNLVLYGDMTPSATSVSINQTFSLSVKVANFGCKDFDGKLAIVAVDENDDSHYYTLNPTSRQISGGMYGTTNFSLSIPEMGTYSLKVYYDGDYDNYYHKVFDYDTYVNGVTVTVSYPQDQYEPNNVVGAAYDLVSVNTNSMTINVNANFHVTTDKDFYKVILPANYNYTINAIIYTSYNTSTYTADGKFATSTDGSTWSNNYGTQMPEMTIHNGGTLYFRVLPYTSNEIGTYQLHITIQRTPPVGIEEIEQCVLRVYPNPTSDFLQISSSFKDAITSVEIITSNGVVVKRLGAYCDEIDVSPLSVGTYFIRIYTQEGMITRKWCKSN